MDLILEASCVQIKKYGLRVFFLFLLGNPPELLEGVGDTGERDECPGGAGQGCGVPGCGLVRGRRRGVEGETLTAS